MNKTKLIEEINKLKSQKKAIIVAHNYQIDDVQDIADFVGDSLALSKISATTKAETIVFCGVLFMAETAKILSPKKTVLLPENDAGCPMADMITADDVKKLRKENPNACIVCYVNTSAKVKAESDVCCTSSNAVKVVASTKEKDIVFIPDKNLGSYVAKMVPDKNIILWDGYCITHHRTRIKEVKKVKELHPDALLLAHPECRHEVVDEADFVGSTKQIIDYSNESPEKKFIIGTEMGILYKLKKDNPDKKFFLLSKTFICPNMKKITLESVYNSLNHTKYKIEIDEGIIKKAVKSLERMHKY